MANRKVSIEDEELTEEIIANLNINKARKISERKKIPIKGLTSVEEIQERFRQHLRQGGEEKHKEVLHVVSDLKDKDDSARRHLQGLLQKLEGILDSCDKKILEQLGLEQHTADHKTKIAEHLQKLQSTDCPILVAGETSSGKSSLINVLLGEDQDLLPSHHLSSSSVICKVQYGEERKATVHYRNMSKPSVDIPLPAGIEDLAEHLFKKADREKESEYKDVDIYLPLEYLKSGIFIVDSPGIGESGVMTSAVMEYLQQAFAFIYVIKSDNAGGVQSDRLKKLLKEVQKRDKLQAINPASAIFVCNRWDIVEQQGEQGAEEVKKDIIRKLRACWSGVQDHQVFFMNTQRAARNLKDGYMAEDFSALIKGIEDLIPRTLQAKIHHSWSWARYLVARTLHHIKSFLLKSNVSSTHLRRRYGRATDELNSLQERAAKMLHEEKTKLEETTDELVELMNTFLWEETTEARMQSWKESQVPAVEKGIDWDVLRYEIESCISARLEETIDEWGMKHFQTRKDGLMKTIMAGMNEVEVQLSEIEGELVNPAGHGYMVAVQPQKPRRKKGVHDLVDFSTENLDLSDKIMLGVSAPLLATFGVIGAVAASPLLAVLGIQALKKKYEDKQERHRYKADKCTYLAERAMEQLEIYRTDGEAIRRYVQERLKLVQDYLQAFQDSLPQKVEAQRKLMQSIEEDQRTAEELTSDYQPLLEMLNTMKTKLALFELEELYLLDPCLVKCDDTDGSAEKFHGVGMTLKKGNVTTINGTRKDATIKSYMNKIDDTTIGDFTAIRKLRHDNILRFVGICFTGEIPQLVLQAADGSLRECLKKAPNVQGVFGLHILPAMKGVCSGLQYLHSKQLVSIFLSQDTVLAFGSDGGDRFKLAHVSEPRALHLSADDYKGPTGPHVYLPPEVLRDHVTYDSRSDMYALGLMMWEVWYEEEVFDDAGGATTLQSFITTMASMQLETSKPHSHSTVEEEAGKAWRDIIHKCMQPPDDRVIKAFQALELLKDLK